MNLKQQSLRKILSGIAVGAVMTMSANVALAVPKILCVFDPLGANGPIFAQIKDYKTEAVAWGVEFDLKPYTDERVAAEDFKSGLCDSVAVSGIRGRQFNPFTGTLDSIGALPDYDLLKDALNTVSSEKAANLMKSGPYEVAGLIPGGSAYLFVNDRNMDTVGELSGKKIAILENDPAQIEMVKRVGASPVGSSIANMFSKFNNKSVDVVYGPAIVYEAMELYKGLEPQGGIIRFSLAQLTLQILIKTEEFPAGFGQKSRDYAISQFDRAVKILKDAEDGIPAKWWVEIPKSDQVNYNEMFRQARIALRDEGVYDGKMLSVLRKLRCRRDATMPECTSADKE